ncbi:F-box protein, partial [Trifolium medium]|nr:F-box protein [Trifolium medium]
LEDLQLLNSSLTLSSRDSDAIQMFQSLSLPKLTRAEITDSLWSHFPLKALSTVKSLSLDTLKLNTHDQTDDDEDDEDNPRQRTYIDIPIFHNLIHLKLNNSWNLVVQMLHHCPKLQSLELSKGSRHSRVDDQENSVEEPELVP